MPTQGSNVTTAWINIASTLSLVVGTPYTIQNTSNTEVKLIEKSTSPAPTDFAHNLMPNEMVDITPETGLGLWVKTTNGNANIAITEV